MFLAVPLLVVGALLLISVGALTVLRKTRERVDTSREWAFVRLTWATAVIAGVVVAWWLSALLDLGRGVMLAPAVLGLFVVAGVGLGEAVVRPRRASGLRTASLAPRRVADYLPQALTTAVGGVTALHLATLGLTTATGTADDMGRAGRQVVATCGDMSSGAGPYPGSFYSVPLIMLLLAIALATTAALMAVVRRPRGLAPDDVGDDVLRQRSATRVVAAGGAAVAASHVGIAFFAGTALLRLDCDSAWMDPAGWVLLASVAAAVLVLGWFLGRIVSPGPSLSTSHMATR